MAFGAIAVERQGEGAGEGGKGRHCARSAEYLGSDEEEEEKRGAEGRAQSGAVIKRPRRK